MANLQAKDLRIGNIVYATVARGPHEPIQYHAIETGEDIDNAKWYFPVLLTAEILESAGFKSSDFGGGQNSIKYQKDYVVLFFNKDENAAFFCYYKDENRKKGRTLYCLHQLQNFYHELTGEELTLNLNQLQPTI